MTEPDLSALPPPTPGPEMRRDAEWQRLDPRMLLVHPIREVLRFLPVIIVVVLGSTAAGGEQWQLIGVGIPIALGLMRYLTTSFRISGGRVELKRGLLNRHVLSTPEDRFPTVDLTSSLYPPAARAHQGPDRDGDGLDERRGPDRPRRAAAGPGPGPAVRAPADLSQADDDEVAAGPAGRRTS